MEEFQFRGIAKDGVVVLPAEYSDKYVEIVIREVSPAPCRKRDLLSPVKIDTAGWKWNREEANER